MGARVLLETELLDVTVAQLGQPWIPREKRVGWPWSPEGPACGPGVVGWAPAQAHPSSSLQPCLWGPSPALWALAVSSLTAGTGCG